MIVSSSLLRFIILEGLFSKDDWSNRYFWMGSPPLLIVASLLDFRLWVSYSLFLHPISSCLKVFSCDFKSFSYLSKNRILLVSARLELLPAYSVGLFEWWLVTYELLVYIYFSIWSWSSLTYFLSLRFSSLSCSLVKLYCLPCFLESVSRI